MKDIGIITEDKYKYSYICSFCGLANNIKTYHVIDFGGFKQILCDDCYDRFKHILDKED